MAKCITGEQCFVDLDTVKSSIAEEGLRVDQRMLSEKNLSVKEKSLKDRASSIAMHIRSKYWMPRVFRVC